MSLWINSPNCTGIAVSKIALGTMYFGSETLEKHAFDILDAYVEAGGNLVDTADVYVGGVAEQIIGRWFAARPRDITITSSSQARAVRAPARIQMALEPRAAICIAP